VACRLVGSALRARPFDGLEAAYASASDGLGSFERRLRYVPINERLAGMNGLPVEAHVGRTVGEIVPALAEGVEPMLRRILETGEPVLDIWISGETSARPGWRTRMESWLPSTAVRGRS
jgi:hypothetical protein